jgi:hypothetical protein
MGSNTTYMFRAVSEPISSVNKFIIPQILKYRISFIATGRTRRGKQPNTRTFSYITHETNERHADRTCSFNSLSSCNS